MNNVNEKFCVLLIAGKHKLQGLYFLSEVCFLVQLYVTKRILAKEFARVQLLLTYTPYFI